ncbi:MAG: hypothetical protein L0099_04775, partial [Acidobacteria bacterium]|nr:hypothetical protein [Acidobacteriota bacterium]
MNNPEQPASHERRQMAKAVAHSGVDWVLAGLGYGAGIFVALLPQRYRRWVEERGGSHLTTAAVASGLLQFLGCLGAVIGRFFLFRQQRMNQWLESEAQGALMGTHGQFTVGLFTVLEYVIQPLTLLLLYFTLEGAVRLLAGIVTGEVVGTLPLQGVAWLHGKAEGRWAEWKLGPRIADLVQKGDGTKYDLRILSCRPKKTWDRMMTIVFLEEFYELV